MMTLTLTHTEQMALTVILLNHHALAPEDDDVTLTILAKINRKPYDREADNAR